MLWLPPVVVRETPPFDPPVELTSPTDVRSPLAALRVIARGAVAPAMLRPPLVAEALSVVDELSAPVVTEAPDRARAPPLVVIAVAPEPAEPLAVTDSAVKVSLASAQVTLPPVE